MNKWTVIQCNSYIRTILYVKFFPTLHPSFFAVPPMSITMSGITGPVSANMAIKVTCRVVGARPDPSVTFLLDGRPIKPDSEKSMEVGNVTESTLLFTPSAEDQGRFLSCQAETPGLLQGKLKDGVKLEVHCESKPIGIKDWYTIDLIKQTVIINWTIKYEHKFKTTSTSLH